MPNGFSFDRALMFPFRAAHARSFPWIFSLAFAAVFTVFLLAVMLLARGEMAEVVASFEALEQMGIDEEDPRTVITAVFGTLRPMIGWANDVHLMIG